MSDTVKLIIEIPRNEYEYTCERILSDRTMWDDAIRKGTPLDDVKAEIEKNAYPIVYGVYNHRKGMTLNGILQVLDNIGKESEVKNDRDNTM